MKWFRFPKIPWYSIYSFLPSPPQPLEIFAHFIASTVLPPPEYHIIGVIQCVAFLYWRFHLTKCIMFPPCVFFCGLIAHSFLLLNSTPSYDCIRVCLTSPPGGHLACSWFGDYGLSCYEHSYRCWCEHKFSNQLAKVDKPLVRSPSETCLALYEIINVSWGGLNILHSWQQWMRVPIAAHPRQQI